MENIEKKLNQIETGFTRDTVNYSHFESKIKEQNFPEPTWAISDEEENQKEEEINSRHSSNQELLYPTGIFFQSTLNFIHLHPYFASSLCFAISGLFLSLFPAPFLSLPIFFTLALTVLLCSVQRYIFPSFSSFPFLLLFLLVLTTPLSFFPSLFFFLSLLPTPLHSFPLRSLILFVCGLVVIRKNARVSSYSFLLLRPFSSFQV